MKSIADQLGTIVFIWFIIYGVVLVLLSVRSSQASRRYRILLYEKEHIIFPSYGDPQGTLKPSDALGMTLPAAVRFRKYLLRTTEDPVMEAARKIALRRWRQAYSWPFVALAGLIMIMLIAVVVAETI